MKCHHCKKDIGIQKVVMGIKIKKICKECLNKYLKERGINQWRMYNTDEQPLDLSMKGGIKTYGEKFSKRKGSPNR